MGTAEVIQRVLNGEERLFEVLVERHAGLVWAICSSYVPNWADREDVAQDVFVQCYTRLHTLRNGSAFGAWLTQLARRTSLDWVRKNARRRETMARHVERNGASESIEDGSRAVEGNELQAFWTERIQQLPAKTREAMFLCCAEERTVSEAAGMLGVSPDTVSKRVAYGRKLLLERAGAELDHAFASQRHRKEYVHAAMGAIPFGTAPWVAGGGAGAGSFVTGKAAVVWGTAVMSKKIVLGVVVGLAVVGFFVAKSLRSSEPPDPNVQVAGNTAAPVENATSSTSPDLMPSTTPGSDESTAPDDTEASAQASAGSAKLSVWTAVIEGTVRDMVGDPIQGALVQVELSDIPGLFRATTDAEGHYVMEGVTAPDELGARAYAWADGYVMQRERVELAPGAHVTDQDFTLDLAEFYIAGRVVSSAGQPIAGARVGTNHYGYGDAGLARMKETDGLDGRGNISGSDFVFAITEPDGTFLLALPIDGYGDVTVTAEGYGAAYYPAVHTGTVNAGFVLPTGGTIAGTVTNAEDQPVKNAIVEIAGHVFPGGLDVGVQELPLPTKYVMTNEDGVYSIDGLGPDFTYTASIRAKPRKAEPLPTESGVAAVGSMLNDVSEMIFTAEAFAAQKTGIRVQSGLIATVDLELGGDTSGTIRGTVTDRTTGEPVPAIAILAIGVDQRVDSLSTREKYQAESGATAVTLLDGTYEVYIPTLNKSRLYAVTYEYYTEGGSAWPSNPDVVATLMLEPGGAETLDFTVDAPVTVPVRYIDINGNPVESILAAMHRAGARHGCGGSLVSNAEGRVEFHGILPDFALEAVAWLDTDHGIVVLGASAPFQGKPGERVPEVIVECHQVGGVDCVVVDSTGNPVALTTFAIRVGTQANGKRPVKCVTDENGYFVVPDLIVGGEYSVVYVGRQLDDGGVEAAIVPDVRIEDGMITNLGAVMIQKYSPDEVNRLFQ